jgi:hypothetical protein
MLGQGGDCLRVTLSASYMQLLLLFASEACAIGLCRANRAVEWPYGQMRTVCMFSIRAEYWLTLQCIPHHSRVSSVEHVVGACQHTISSLVVYTDASGMVPLLATIRRSFIAGFHVK